MLDDLADSYIVACRWGGIARMLRGFLKQYWSVSEPVLLRSPTSTGNIYRPVLVSSVTSTGCLPLLYRKDYLASRDCATLSVPLQEECPTQAP